MPNNNNKAVPALKEKDVFSRVWLKERRKEEKKVEMRARRHLKKAGETTGQVLEDT